MARTIPPNTRQYARGTRLTMTSGPFATFRTGRVMCSDGTVRTLKRIAPTADTMFSIPASVTVNGRTVAGYVTVETVAGSSIWTDDDPAVAKFVAYTYRSNGDALPSGLWREHGDACTECHGDYPAVPAHPYMTDGPAANPGCSCGEADLGAPGHDSHA